MSRDEVKRFLDWLQQHEDERRRFQEMEDHNVADAARVLGFTFSVKDLRDELEKMQRTEWVFFR